VIDRFGSPAAVQNSEKTLVQCPSLPDSGSSEGLELTVPF
jgi:hypothetical protein